MHLSSVSQKSVIDAEDIPSGCWDRMPPLLKCVKVEEEQREEAILHYINKYSDGEDNWNWVFT
jgi:hypothetical protein